MLKEKSKQIDKNIEDVKNVETNVENIDKIILRILNGNLQKRFY